MTATLPKTMRINVTARHIQAGRRCHCGDCPLALAMQEATGEEWFISPTHYWRADDSGTIFRLPVLARALVENFDAGRQVMPLALEMEIA